MSGALVHPDGRPSTTGYRVRERFPGWTLLELDLVTGRTHQIRVHLDGIGHPVAGDPVYGTGFKSKLRKLPAAVQEKLAGFDRQALHAASLSFVHPTTGTLLEFNSRLPEDFAMIVDALKEL